MRWTSILVLIMLTFTIVTPISLFSLIMTENKDEMLMNLDVCHSAAPALSSNGEMPCVSVCPSTSDPTISISTQTPAHQILKELLLTSRNEHPPRS
jgi:hypothetical protein